MALTNESDETARNHQISSKEDAFAAWRSWLNWGENDKVGAHLIHEIARFGAGDPEIIEFLEGRTKSGIAAIGSAASSALIGLEGEGDQLASAARKRCQDYKDEQHNAALKARAQRQREELKKQAVALGISVEELSQRNEQARLAELATAEEWRQELALPSQFHSGQTVQCVVQGWPYTDAIGVVERAVTKYFLTVKFADCYRTTQSDSAFQLLDVAGHAPNLGDDL
jgi:hypothetical protein